MPARAGSERGSEPPGVEDRGAAPPVSHLPHPQRVSTLGRQAEAGGVGAALGGGGTAEPRTHLKQRGRGMLEAGRGAVPRQLAPRGSSRGCLRARQPRPHSELPDQPRAESCSGCRHGTPFHARAPGLASRPAILQAQGEDTECRPTPFEAGFSSRIHRAERLTESARLRGRRLTSEPHASASTKPKESRQEEVERSLPGSAVPEGGPSKRCSCSPVAAGCRDAGPRAPSAAEPQPRSVHLKQSCAAASVPFAKSVTEEQ